MKNTSYIITTSLLLLTSTIFIAISGCNTYLRIVLNLTLFIAYFIFTWYALYSKCKEYTDKIKKLTSDLKRLNFEVQVTSSQISSVSENMSVTLDENNVFAKYVYDEVTEMANNNERVNISIDNTLSEVKNIMNLLMISTKYSIISYTK